jgi:hypothetical protein
MEADDGCYHRSRHGAYHLQYHGYVQVLEATVNRNQMKQIDAIGVVGYIGSDPADNPYGCLSKVRNCQTDNEARDPTTPMNTGRFEGTRISRTLSVGILTICRA